MNMFNLHPVTKEEGFQMMMIKKQGEELFRDVTEAHQGAIDH
jgi:hypothetical protein